MSTTSREEELVDLEAERIQEYIETNGQELYQFFMDNATALESVCNLMVLCWDDELAWHSIKTRIKFEIKTESYDKARERVYGD